MQMTLVEREDCPAWYVHPRYTRTDIEAMLIEAQCQNSHCVTFIKMA
jgi:hypothetical protein